MIPEERTGKAGGQSGKTLPKTLATDVSRMGRTAALLCLLTALALGGLAQAQLAQDRIAPGLALYAVAIPLFAAAVSRSGGQRQAEDDRHRLALNLPDVRLRTGRGRLVGAALCALAIVFSIVSLVLFLSDAGQTGLAWSAYAASLLLFVAGIRQASPAARMRSSIPRAELALLGAILLLALLLRVLRLAEYPYGIWYDEAQIGLEARAALQNLAALPVYAPSASQIAHHLFLFAASLRLFGDTIFGLRMTSALFGVAGVLAAYLLGREYRGGRWGLLLAFIVATMRWHVNFSRIAMNGVDAPFFEFLALYFAVRLLRRPSGTLVSAAGLGLSVGLGLCFYSATRLFVAALCLFAAGWWLVTKLRRRSGRQPALSAGNDRSSVGAALCVGVLLVTVCLAVMPTAQFALRHPEIFWKRTQQVSIFAKAGDADKVQLLADNVEKHLLMFNYRGDRNGRHNLPNAPTVDHVTGVLLFLGLAVALARRDALGHFFWLMLP
ncbi:MAG: hypothetical protein E3J64_05145, partial [Anaerolineales bacterium]